MRQALLLLAVTALGACASTPKTLASPEPQAQVVQVDVETTPTTPTPETLEPLSTEDSSTAEPTPEPVAVKTTRDLCEPVDSRRPYPTRAERNETKALIRQTCRALGVDTNACKLFMIFSLRESSYRWWVRHKKPGDTSAAVVGWLDSASRYGWQIEWPLDARRQSDLTAIVMQPNKTGANPYYPDVHRWLTGGLGLGGINVGYHLSKIDDTAPPEILCDPILNIIVQVSIARSAQDHYDAYSAFQVQAVYGGRTFRDSNGRKRAMTCVGGCPEEIQGDQPKNVSRRTRAIRGDRNMRRRCAAVGMDCTVKLNLGQVLRGSDVTPADRYKFADELRGETLPPFDTPTDDVAPTVKVGDG